MQAYFPSLDLLNNVFINNVFIRGMYVLTRYKYLLKLRGEKPLDGTVNKILTNGS